MPKRSVVGALNSVRSINAAQSFNQWYASNLDYNAQGVVTLMQLGNSVTTPCTYDPLNFRLRQLQSGANGALQNLQYRYDKIGNVLTITDTASFGPTAPQYQTFTYDSLDRLNTAVVTGAVTGTYTGTYAYNAIGNITNTSRLGDYGYPASGANSVRPHAVISAGNNLYNYDANGNMLTRVEVSGTQRITYTQQWNAENRLVVVTNTNTLSVTKYFYDGDGQRVKKIDPNGQTTIYIGAIYEKNLSTTVTTTYYFAGSTRLAMRQGGTLYYFVADHLGSTSVTLDANGTKIGEMKYYPFGETRPGYPSGSVPTDRRYTGQRQEDSGLGSLYDFNARFFSPSLGRFISADTIVPNPNSPQQFNRFSYALNNPLKHVDPTGHMCLENEFANKAGPCDIQYYSSFSYSSIQQEGLKYGVPWQVVAAILASEKAIDTGSEDAIQDFMYSHVPALAYGFDRLRGEDNPGVGVGNVHLGTAWRISEYFKAKYGSSDQMQLGLEASDKPYLVAHGLVDTSNNTRFVAAYVRMLSDYRFGSNGEPSHKSHLALQDWAITDVVAIWHAYRYGIKDLDSGPGFESIKDFQNRTISLEDLIIKVIGIPAAPSAVRSVPIITDYLNR